MLNYDLLSYNAKRTISRNHESGTDGEQTMLSLYDQNCSKTQRQKLDKLAQHYEIAANRFHPGHPQLPVTLINISIALLSKVLA